MLVAVRVRVSDFRNNPYFFVKIESGDSAASDNS